MAYKIQHLSKVNGKSFLAGIEVSDAVLYDPLIVEAMKNGTTFWWRMAYWYTSNWRVLRIDGFEGYIFARHLLPVHKGRKFEFFGYSDKTEPAWPAPDATGAITKDGDLEFPGKLA